MSALSIPSIALEIAIPAHVSNNSDSNTENSTPHGSHVSSIDKILRAANGKSNSWDLSTKLPSVWAGETERKIRGKVSDTWNKVDFSKAWKVDIVEDQASSNPLYLVAWGLESHD